MSLLVTGSIGIDAVQTPHGNRKELIGGSAVYFSYAASFFTPVRLVGVVGDDCPPSLLNVFQGRDVDTGGLEIRKGSKTFRWHGSYVKNMNEAVTVEVDLNVLAENAAVIPEKFKDSGNVFLANSHPRIQLQTLQALHGPKLVVADTMNLWIEVERPALLDLLKHVHGLVLNDGEARLLTQKQNLVEAARAVLKMGPKFVVVKKGEHGCMLVSEGDTFVLPAFPTEKVVDPTGAGDSFAGGMMGYLASHTDHSMTAVKKALAFGTVVASYTIADFSLDGLKAATREAIDQRLTHLRAAVTF
jgi:sugar/nucleoside kinase (ribokinase family)